MASLLDHILKEHQKKSKARHNVMRTFLTEHPDYDELVKKSNEINKILKKMRKDFKPHKDLEIYKDDIQEYISDCISNTIEKK